MSRIVSFVLLGGLILVAAAAIKINDVDARQQTDFVQISVLAEGRANYGVDENPITIPAVSMEIIADKVQDSQRQSLVPVITYTSLPTKEPRPTRQDDEEAASVDEVKRDENHTNNGNDNANQNGGNGNENAGGNGNGNNAENNKAKEDKPDKDKGNSNQSGNKGNDGGSDNNKSGEQENKPDKAE